MKWLLREEWLFPKYSLWDRAAECRFSKLRGCWQGRPQPLVPTGRPQEPNALGGVAGARDSQDPSSIWGCQNLGAQHFPAGMDTGEKLPDRRAAKPALVSDQILQELSTGAGNTRSNRSPVLSLLSQKWFCFFLPVFLEVISFMLSCKMKMSKISFHVYSQYRCSTLQMVAEIHL